jgi:hypothetical protein
MIRKTVWKRKLKIKTYQLSFSKYLFLKKKKHMKATEVSK